MNKKNNLAKTPPMGWNSWDCYGAAVNEEQLLGNAQYMADNLAAFGWEYIVCDIQWSEPTAGQSGWAYVPFAELAIDEYGRQIPTVNRFPSAANEVGFKYIADKIHDMGLKFGIHIMRGVPRRAVHGRLQVLGADIGTTCDKIALENSICKWNNDMYGVDYRKPGAQAYYDSIFKLYAQWGVDFVKVDDICNTNAYEHNPYSAEKEIEMIRHAIDNSGRGMVLSLSPGPAVIEKAWHMRKNANMWRITDDFWDNWYLLKQMFERCEVWQRQVSEGCWPDCDMLPLGKIRITDDGKGYLTHLTKDEQVTMMTLWSVFRSPLIMGGEMRENDDWTLKLLTNSEVLRLNKYSDGAEQISRDENQVIWTSQDTQDGSKYLAMFNISDDDRKLDIPKEFHGASLRDLWLKKDITKTQSVQIPLHGAKLFKVIL